MVYEFRHAVVRDTLYAEFGLQQARVLHGAVAEAMEAHWGSSALRHADREAADYLRGARETLEATGRVEARPDRVPILKDLARACQRLGEYDAAVEAWGRALGLLEE